MERCPECGKEIDWDKGVCMNCGLVIEDRPISNEPERRYPNDEGYGVVYQTNLQQQFFNYATTHSNKTKDPNLQRAFRSENIYKNGNPESYAIFVEIKRICSSLQLPTNFAEECLFLFNQLLAIKPDFFRRRYFKYAVISAVVLIVCKQHDYPILMDHVFKVSTEKPSHIKRAFFDVVQLLGFDRDVRLGIYVEAAVRLLIKDSDSKVVRQFIKDVEKISKIVEKHLNISGRKPIGYIAAIIYMHGKTKFGLKLGRISEKLNVSIPTITSRRNEIQRLIRRIKK